MIFGKNSDGGTMGCQPVEEPAVEEPEYLEGPEYSYKKRINSTKSSAQNMFEKDSAMKFLGKSFVEIKEVLGEPDEEGYSYSNQKRGLHNYIMRFRYKHGTIIFSSPKDMKNKIAVSIILV